MKTTQNHKTIDFNIKLSANDKEMLQALAKDRGCTMTEIMRATITTQFRMRFANEPKCTNGATCLCPNMHTLQSASRPSDSEILEGLGTPNGTP